MKRSSFFKVILSAALVVGPMIFVNAQTSTNNNCTHTVSGSQIVVGAGQVFCLNSGSWTGGVKIEAGGKLVVNQGATFTASWVDGNVNGEIVNLGTITMPIYGGAVVINNYGNFNSSSLQGLTGVFNNKVGGRLNMANGTISFKPGSKFINEGKTYLGNGSFDLQNATIVSSDSFVVNGSFNANYPNNVISIKGNSFASIAMGTGGISFAGLLENTGTLKMKQLNNLSATVNNSGIMEIHNAVNNISTNTNFTNDSILRFVQVNNVEMNNGKITNNGRMEFNHTDANTGGIKLNGNAAQMHNNGIIVAKGDIALNSGGSKVVNNCRIVANRIMVYGGTTFTNNGLVWSTYNGTDYSLLIEGGNATFNNSNEAFVRGKNFRNSGVVKGAGIFHFTGNTNFQSAGTIEGLSATNPIQFYDASQTGSQIFDAFVASNPAKNTIRPQSVMLLDTTAYNCSSPVSVAGYAPMTRTIAKNVCAVAPISIDLNQYVEPHQSTGGQNFTVLMNTARLFDKNNPNNVTNNSTHLVVPGKGSFNLNVTNGTVSFTPEQGFQAGEVDVQFRVSNAGSVDNTIYPSSKTDIFISIGGSVIAPQISVTTY